MVCGTRYGAVVLVLLPSDVSQYTPVVIQIMDTGVAPGRGGGGEGGGRMLQQSLR